MNLLWTSEALVAATGGRPIGQMPEGISGISIDSRSLNAGEAFFAIKGETMDGHDFATAAVKAQTPAQTRPAPAVIAPTAAKVLPSPTSQRCICSRRGPACSLRRAIN